MLEALSHRRAHLRKACREHSCCACLPVPGNKTALSLGNCLSPANTYVAPEKAANDRTHIHTHACRDADTDTHTRQRGMGTWPQATLTGRQQERGTGVLLPLM